MCTSNKDMKSRKEELVQKWKNIISLYQKVKNNPSFKRWGKLLFEVCKIFLSVLFKKAVDDWFRNF